VVVEFVGASVDIEELPLRPGESISATFTLFPPNIPTSVDYIPIDGIPIGIHTIRMDVNHQLRTWHFSRLANIEIRLEVISYYNEEDSCEKICYYH